MLIVRPLLAAALALVVLTPSVDAAKGKKKKGDNARGVVEAVSIENGTGSITIKAREHKKKKKNASTTTFVAAKGEKKATKEMTFKVNASTKIEKVSGKKGAKETSAAALVDVQKGSHVRVHAKGDVAERIEIVAKKKGKGKKKKADV
jgi:hypothetical protein